MHWLIFVNLITILLRRSEGFEDENGTSNLQSKIKTSHELTSIMCFKCHQCDHVGIHTAKVECASPNCCYTAHVKNRTYGLVYIIRDCGKWDSVDGCKITCKEARNDYLWMNPLGEFIKCITCNEGDSNECNGQNYEELNPVVSIMCYRCRKCNEITTDTPKIRCPFPQCCFTALVTDQPNEGMFAVRGCILSNKPCFGKCNKKKRQHLLAHTNGTFDYCMTCNAGDSDGCNSNNYSQSNLASPTAVRCYECRNCNMVLSTTPTIPCPHPKCCYITILKDNQGGHSVVVRGCIKESENCSMTCKTIENNYVQGHYEGTFSFCVACGDSEGDYCNGNTYNPITLAINEASNETKCFSCENCNEITKDTAQIACPSSCCYSKIIHGIFERGCVRYLSGRCDEFCVTQVHDFCDSCSGSLCNIRRMNGLHTVYKRRSYIHCYKCIDCYFISDKLHQTVDCPSGCCVVVWWTTERESMMSRMCVNLYGKRCEDYCEHTRQVLKSEDPKRVVHYCEQCTTDKCNDIAIYRSQLIANEHPHINCYHCDDCKDTMPSTPAETVLCITGCCYTAVLQINEKFRWVRACAKLGSDRLCQNYCQYLESEIKKDDPTGSVVNCATCTTDRCNNYKPSIVIGSKYIQTKYSMNIKGLEEHKLTERIPILEQDYMYENYNPITCYNCIGCYDIDNNTETIVCPENCCYSAIWTENDVIMMARLCAFLEGKQCARLCDALTERLNSRRHNDILHHCSTCCSSNCNSESFPEPEDVATYVPNCYSCKSCDQISDNTNEVSCLSGCCYSILKRLDNGRRATIRDCAKLSPGTPCVLFCSEATKLHNRSDPAGAMIYCKSCGSDECNSVRLDSDETGVTNKPPIKCFDCDDCYWIDKQTAKQCKTGCCITVVWTEFNITYLRRDCIQADETPCSRYCENAERSVKYIDPEGTINDCDVCRDDKCNILKANYPLSRSGIWCYECSNCDELSLNANIVECVSFCCILYVWRYDYTNIIHITRSCEVAWLTPGIPCKKVCDDEDTEELIYCYSCQEDRCNHAPMRDVRQTDYFRRHLEKYNEKHKNQTTV